MGTDELGAFEVAFSVYLFMAGASRALGSEPLLVRHSDTGAAEMAPAAAAVVGTALLGGLAAGATCMTFGVVVGGTVGPPMIALGLCLPALLTQDAWRYVFFAAGRPAKAVANDGIWAVVQLALVIGLLVWSEPTVAALVMAWGLAAAVAAVAGVVQAGVRPRPSRARRWLADQRDLGSRYLGEFVVGQGAAQLSLWSIGVVGGLTVLGTLRAGGVLVGPMRLFLTAAPGAAIPELIRIRHRSPERFARLVLHISWALAALVAVWGLVVWALPASVGESVLGENWEPGRSVLPLLSLSWAALGLGTGAMVGLRVLADAGASLRARLLICPVVLVVPAVSVVLGDAVGAAGGLAATSIWSAGVWWYVYRGSLRRSAGVVSSPIAPAAHEVS